MDYRWGVNGTGIREGVLRELIIANLHTAEGVCVVAKDDYGKEKK